MSPMCVVVADSANARFFDVGLSDAPRVKHVLVERAVLSNPDLRELGTSVTGRSRAETNTNRQAGPMHPIGARRERHRLELERRFSLEIAREAAEISRDWQTGTLLLVAGPQMLGLLRETMRGALHAGIELKELAKDYAGLSAAQIGSRLEIRI